MITITMTAEKMWNYTFVKRIDGFVFIVFFMNSNIDAICLPNQRVLTQVLIFYSQILGARRTLWLGDYYFNGNPFWQPDKTSF